MEALEAYSIINYLSDHIGHRCGYCGGRNTNYSHGMWAYLMTCDDYEDLINRGCRRSGHYVYKPTMDTTCCPCYSVKCLPMEFRLSKSHRKVLKSMTRFLRTGARRNFSPKEMGEAERADSRPEGVKPSRVPDASKESAEGAGSSAASSNLGGEKGGETSLGGDSPSEKTTQPKPMKQGKIPRPGEGIDPSKPPCKKAKQLRLEKKLAKQSQKAASGNATDPSNQLTVPKEKVNTSPQDEEMSEGSLVDPTMGRSTQQAGKTLREFVEEHNNPGPGDKHKLELTLVRAGKESPEYIRTEAETHALFQKYQRVIHNDPEEELQLKSYTRFLVDSPLREAHLPGAPAHGFGTFHQHYRLDGKLIAVAVLDILPKSLSSVYFFYDPDYGFLSLGNYSALREIALTQEIHSSFSQMTQYYMGFYIHNCQKMKYKRHFPPSYLLCPVTYSWVPFEICAPKLDEKPYCRLDDTEKEEEQADYKKVQLYFRRTVMTYELYQPLSQMGEYYTAEVKEYAEVFGKECCEKLLLILQ